MSEYWKSNAKKYCDYCKVWIADNKASIGIHESGKSHKIKVKEKLEEIKKRSNEKKAEDNKASKAMAAIERAALDAMQKDLSSNPRLRHQYGQETVAAAAATAFEPVEKKPEKQSSSKSTTSTQKKSTNKTQTVAKRKAEPEPEAQKIGKWQRVTPVQPVVTTRGVIDLQLPNSSGPTSKFESSIEKLQNEMHDSDQKSTEPKPKWNPVGFQPVETDNIKPVKKLEPNEEVIIKNEAQEIEINQPKIASENVNSETKLKTDEKIVTLDGVFKSNKKIVAFKKRNTDSAQQNLRKKQNSN